MAVEKMILLSRNQQGGSIFDQPEHFMTTDLNVTMINRAQDCSLLKVTLPSRWAEKSVIFFIRRRVYTLCNETNIFITGI
jgi:hypothetical protein